MTEKKKAPPLKQAGATQRMSKNELADLLKQAEAADPEDGDEADGDAAAAKPTKPDAPKKK